MTRECDSSEQGRHLQHGGRELGEVAAQEARVRLGDLDQQLQRVLRAGLLALVQQAAHHRQLRRDGRLELVALRGVLQLLAQPARASSGNSSMHVSRACAQGGLTEWKEKTKGRCEARWYQQQCLARHSSQLPCVKPCFPTSSSELQTLCIHGNTSSGRAAHLF